jgi:hypothetical protein
LLLRRLDMYLQAQHQQTCDCGAGSATPPRTREPAQAHDAPALLVAASSERDAVCAQVDVEVGQVEVQPIAAAESC